MKVVVLGATGMLGSMVLKVLASELALELCSTVQYPIVDDLNIPVGRSEICILDVLKCQPSEIEAILNKADWAINCIGVIKPYINDRDPQERQEALCVNALFPYVLARVSEHIGCQVIQIATDCVYAGTKGRYVESDPHDAWDVYGKTKSLGEVPSPCMHHIRCSIIGPELTGKKSLLEWFLGQSRGAQIPGFTNHFWNGITTLHFGRICRGIIQQTLPLPNLCHVIPGSSSSKGELLKIFAKIYGRDDLKILLEPAPNEVDRTLATKQPALNIGLWQAAGYDTPPTLASMVEELSTYSQGSKRIRE